jgi:hypothetical protein
MLAPADLDRELKDFRSTQVTERRHDPICMARYWCGKYWSKWGDALAEAEFPPNSFQLPYNELQLVRPLTLLVRELGRFPVEAELRIKARSDKTFPSHTVFAKLGQREIAPARCSTTALRRRASMTWLPSAAS